MIGEESTKQPGGGYRSSRIFIYIVVNLAVFTDSYIYGLIIPVLPFALVERVNVSENEVQQWIGILLAAYGAGLIVGSREWNHFCTSKKLQKEFQSLMSALLTQK